MVSWAVIACNSCTYILDVIIYLARTAKLPTGLYSLPSVIFVPFFLFFFVFIFNDFSETNYLRIRWTNFRSDVAMATDFVKNGKLCTFVALAFRNGIG